MKIDLHTHSNASDGELSPVALVRLASDAGVDMLSITDHDTLAAYADLRTPDAMRLIPGIELSSHWLKHGVHIVGLNLDLASPAIAAAIARQQEARLLRAERIADRLLAGGIGIDLSQVLERAAGGSVGRPHFAAELVESGIAKDRRTAFRKYLGAGKAGDVKTLWPKMDEVIGWIRDAGGCAVLAHPAKYRLTWTRRRLFITDFERAGGGALEMVCGPQTPELTRRLAALAVDHGLAVSGGSD
ncbi:MAG: PHP domain-containing protein, partial [Pseudomonadota bacterium]